MIALSSTLEAAQKAKRRLNPIVKIVLSNNGTTKTYLNDRILVYTSTRSQWSHVVELTLHNADGVITALNFKGYKAIVSRGLVAAGDEYAALDPLWCFTHKYDSGRTEWAGLRPSTLRLIGTFDRMNLESASEEYRPDSADTKTIKTLLTEVAEATMVGFKHCQAYTITFDATEETLLDTFTPSDSFRVGFGESRLSVFRKLMAYVKSVARVEDDEEIHVLNPTVTGATYAYEYKLDVEDEHTYFTEGYRRRLVTPNLITITSHPDSGTAVAGSADYSGSSTASDNALLSIVDFQRMRVVSDAEAEDVADAKIQKLEQAADKGYLVSTINVGQELFDYIKITDQRLGLDRVGNVGQIVERYKPGAPNPWQMSLSLGTTPTTIIPFIPGDFKGPVVTSEMWLQHLDDLQKFADFVIAVLEDHEDRITALEGGVTGRASRILFDGSVDTPTSVGWGLEAELPFTPTGSLYFSPVIEEVPGIDVVYVIDRSATEFWKYNITQKEWTQLSTTNLNTATNAYRTLVPNPLSTQIWCIDGDMPSTKLAKYIIATDTWALSSAAPDILTQTADIKSFVFEDDDKIWAWVRRGTHQDQGKCIKYVPSTNTWTQYTNDTGDLGTSANWQGRCAAIRGTTIVYGGAIGAVTKYCTYTIATDTYAVSAADADANYSWSYDKDKLWYHDTSDSRQGYLDTADDSANDDQFAENTDKSSGYGIVYGVNDAGTTIVAWARSTAPRLMSVIDGGTYLLGTFYGSIEATLKIEKPDDNYAVLCVNTDGVWASQSYDHSAYAWLGPGTWKLYYPQAGDYTRIKIIVLYD